MQIKKRFHLSTIAVVLGGLALSGGIGKFGQHEDGGDMFHIGITVLLGTLSYRSLKRRKLGLRPNSRGRRLAEAVAIVFLIALTVFLKGILVLMYDDPVPYLIIPIWSLVPYLVLALTHPATDIIDDHRKTATV